MHPSRARQGHPDQISEQNYFTDGLIVPVGQKHRRRPGKKTDYVLAFKPDFPIAFVEVKGTLPKLGWS